MKKNCNAAVHLLRSSERIGFLLAPLADLGALRAREVLLGERHPQTELAARGRALSAHLLKLRNVTRYFSAD